MQHFYWQEFVDMQQLLDCGNVDLTSDGIRQINGVMKKKMYNDTRQIIHLVLPTALISDYIIVTAITKAINIFQRDLSTAADYEREIAIVEETIIFSEDITNEQKREFALKCLHTRTNEYCQTLHTIARYYELLDPYTTRLYFCVDELMFFVIF